MKMQCITNNMASSVGRKVESWIRAWHVMCWCSGAWVVCCWWWQLCHSIHNVTDWPWQAEVYIWQSLQKLIFSDNHYPGEKPTPTNYKCSQNTTQNRSRSTGIRGWFASACADSPLLHMLAGEGRLYGEKTGLFSKPPPHAFTKTSAAVPPLGVGMAVG